MDAQNMALRLALALRQYHEGATAKQVVQMIEQNCRIDSFDTVGSIKPFDCKFQHDMIGGCLNGDTIEVVHPGFKFEGKVLLRAEVIPHK